MRLLFTKGNSALSKVIRFVCAQDCSHFAIVLYEDSVGPIVFESNLLGTHPAFYQTWLKKHEIIHEIKISKSSISEDKIMDIIIKQYDGKGYDYSGALYLGYRKLLNRFFNIKIPTSNKWAKSDQYFCDEIYDVFNQIDGFPKLAVSNGMDSPHDVWFKIKDYFGGLNG